MTGSTIRRTISEFQKGIDASASFQDVMSYQIVCNRRDRSWLASLQIGVRPEQINQSASMTKLRELTGACRRIVELAAVADKMPRRSLLSSGVTLRNGRVRFMNL